MTDEAGAGGVAPSPVDETWRRLLIENPRARRNRRIHRHIPSAPRCKLCFAPFGLPGSLVMSMLDHRRWPRNPKYCSGCFRMLLQNHGGAEVECSLLFADVRGSTAMAETMSPKEFNRVMGRFHDVAFDVLVNHDAFFDKFVGDEIIGIFVPAMAGSTHSQSAVDAAVELLKRTGHEDPAGPWVPVGIGVSTGVAYVGVVGEGPGTDLTAMGDIVNTNARLASAAEAGQILVAGFPVEALAGSERRTLMLRGKADPTEVTVLRVGPQQRLP